MDKWKFDWVHIGSQHIGTLLKQSQWPLGFDGIYFISFAIAEVVLMTTELKQKAKCEQLNRTDNSPTQKPLNFSFSDSTQSI